ncbi:hypothetical protein G6F62_012891 [Rhizopus arrhizus]|nr:hypothetical protein G6F62_012891 [Rhizopus arrhizus]
MDVETYLLQLYLQQGYDVAMVAANDFLRQWESCDVGPQNPVYEIEGESVTREEYAKYLMEDIVSLDRLINGQVTYNNGANCVIQNGNATNEQCDWEEQDNQEILVQLENLIRHQYEQYVHILQEIERLEELRDSLCDLFATNVCHWAHFRLNQPKPNAQDIGLYLSAKQTLLKTFVPGYSFYRALSIKVKQVDSWIRIEDDSSTGTGICNQEESNNVTPDQAENFQNSDIIH